jgi:hypothetical protein
LCFKKGFRAFPEEYIPLKLLKKGVIGMLEFEQSEKKEKKKWDEVLPLGELELVSLNTMIPRKVSKSLREATGWLQLSSPNLRYTKQATVQYLLERGLQALYEDIEKADQTQHEDSSESASIELAHDSKVIDLIQANRKGYDVKDYETFSNKHPGGYRFGR